MWKLRGIPSSVAYVGHESHEAGAFDGLGDGVLADCVAARLAAADDFAVAVGELRQQVDVFVVDVHRLGADAIDEDRILLGNLLDVGAAPVLLVLVGVSAGHNFDSTLGRKVEMRPDLAF